MQNMDQKIAQARKALGMTQEKLAEAMGVSRQTVSHWENGRVQPDEETAARLLQVLQIQQDQPAVPAKKPRLLWPVVIAFVCGVLAALIVVYGVVPLFAPAEPPAAPAAAQEPAAMYSWDWFQQPDVMEEGKAFIKMSPVRSPVPLTRDDSFDVQYVWKVNYTIQEVNGVPFTVEKFTEVFFNQEKGTLALYDLVGDECKRYWNNLTFQPNEAVGFNANKGIGGVIGYGAAMEGVDANGNKLVFKVYIPFTHDVEKPVTLDSFMAENVPQEGMAFLNIYANNVPVPQVYDPVFEGDWGWKHQYFVENTTDIPFSIDVITEVFFKGETAVSINPYHKEMLIQWGDDPVLVKGQPYEGGGGANTQMEYTGLGVKVEGTDEKGNKLTFVYYLPYAQEKPQE